MKILITPIKKIIRKFLKKYGYDLIRTNPKLNIGYDPFETLCHYYSFTGTTPSIIFDVGANQGNTTLKLTSLFPKANYFLFEPIPALAINLKEKFNLYSNITLNNFALGETNGTKIFHENSFKEMSSILAATTESWGSIVNNYEVKTLTIDNYMIENNIKKVDFLKIDTQGYDLQILKGASSALKTNSISFIMVELIFNNLYHQQPHFSEICKFLDNNEYYLIQFFDINIKNSKMEFCDALFVSKLFYQKILN